MEKTKQLSNKFVNQILEQEYAPAQQTIQELVNEKLKKRISAAQKDVLNKKK